jgi:hypothetical protein
MHEECSRLVRGFIAGDPIDTERYIDCYKRSVQYSEEYETMMINALQLDVESDIIYSKNN